MKILVADNLNKQAIEILAKEKDFEVDQKIGLTEDELVKIVQNYDAMLVRSGVKVTKKIIDSAVNMRIIGRAGVGVDNIDVIAAKAKGIAVMNTPFGNVNSAAEHTIGMILALSRHIHHGHHSLFHKKEWERKKFTGVELKGKVLGVIGFGNVGRIVAKIAHKGFEMNVIGYDPFVDAESMKKLGVKKVELEELIKASDFITLHTVLIPATRNMLDKPQFEMMKPGVRIINVGRGGLINEKSLLDALNAGKVAGAAIDVWENEPPFESPLLKSPDILATPHLGASTKEAQENVSIDIAHQLIDALKKGVLMHVVNGISELKQ